MKIDIDLIKKKSEHNEGLLEELEEIALHQLQIKKIECLNIYCKNLKILLLQHNLIDKIENLKQLKKLEYLNLALNNITVIENLNQCESLKKLDLTLNFIDIMSIEISINNLKSNKNLRELYLMGNPCMKWKYCMYYVIYELPQLEYFDGSEIVASHRIKSKQLYKHILASLEEEKKIFQSIPPDASFDCIKSRKEIYEEVEKENEKEKEAMKKRDTEKNIEKKEISSIFTNDGEIRQCNEGQYKFMFDEYSSNKYSFLKLYLPKYLCNSLIEIDLNIHYFRCVVNKKVFQIKFHDPILTDCSKISRKKYTGELCVKMRKENYKKNKIVENKYLNNSSDFLSLEHYNSLSSSDSDSRSSSSSSSFFTNKRFPFQEKYTKNRFQQRKREKTYKLEKEKEKELHINSLLDQKREDDFLIEEKERKYYSSTLNQLPPLQKIQKRGNFGIRQKI